jgi:hypothetical protein
LAQADNEDFAELLPVLRKTLKASIQNKEALGDWLDLADTIAATTPKSFEAHLKFYGFNDKDCMTPSHPAQRL